VTEDLMTPEIVRIRTAYEGWTKLLVATIKGTDGKHFNREIEDHGQAVAVLPYDPVRRVALLVSLLRAPVLYAGGPGELLEVPAGMVEEGDAADAVKREALEETGLRLGTLEHVVTAWSSPGLSSEKIDLYLAAYSPADRVETGGGLVEENENITVVEMPLAELWALVETQELTDLKTLALVLTLKHRQPDLFAPL
jgi:nudix-type nucleoside diphosphatase (YffH/AdpP family)